MELNLQKMLSPNGESDSGSVVFHLSERDFVGFCVPGPVQTHYRAVGTNGAVDLQFTISTEIEADCARCLKFFKRLWRVEREYRITKADLLEEFPELPYTAAGGLSLEELAYEELLLDVDPVLLCSEACEGLCQRCGKPAGECGCLPEKEGDPRLQVLKQLLSKEDIKP